MNHWQEYRKSLAIGLAFILAGPLYSGCDQPTMKENQTNSLVIPTDTQKDSEKASDSVDDFIEYSQRDRATKVSNQDDSQLEIFSIYPSTISTDSTKLLISGIGFNAQETVIRIGTFECSSLTELSSDLFSCKSSPNANPGLYDVSVKRLTDGSTVTLRKSIEVIDLPKIVSVSPKSVNVQGGEKIYIFGTGFSKGLKISLQDEPCTEVNILSENLADCIAPAAKKSGNPNLVVTNILDQSAVFVGDFKYVINSSISKISPHEVNELGEDASGSRVVTLTGVGLKTVESIRVASGTCTDLVIESDTKISCTLPTQANSLAPLNYPVDVYAVFEEGREVIAEPENKLTYMTPPVIETMSPQSGILAGGEVLELYGTNFTSTMSVHLHPSSDPTNEVECTNYVIDTSAIYCNLPAAATDGSLDYIPGNYKIYAKNNLNMVSSKLDYYYRPLPTITAVADEISGIAITQNSGLRTLTITGENFFSYGNTSLQVKISGKPCLPNSPPTPTSIDCSISFNEGYVGFTDIEVINSDGQKVLLEDGLYLNGAPEIDSIVDQATGLSYRDPTQAVTLLVSGDNFVAGTKIFFGGGLNSNGEVECQNVQIIDLNSLTCDFPEVTPISGYYHKSHLGYLKVKIVTGDGQIKVYEDNSLLFDNRFPAPVITDVVCLDPNNISEAIESEIDDKYCMGKTNSGGDYKIKLKGTGLLHGLKIKIYGNLAFPILDTTDTTAMYLQRSSDYQGSEASVVVSFNNGVFGSYDIRLYEHLTVTSIDVTERPYNQPVSLNIGGAGFFDDMTSKALIERVSIGAQECTGLNVVSNNLLTCNLPAGAVSDIGTYPINVKPFYNDGGTDGPNFSNKHLELSATGLVVDPPQVVTNAQSKITLTLNENWFGENDGGTMINFMNEEPAEILLGATLCLEAEIITPNSIQCIKQSGLDPTGTANVSLIRSDGETATFANAITYLANPTGSGFSPAYTPYNGGGLLQFTTQSHPDALWTRVLVENHDCAPTLFIPATGTIECMLDNIPFTNEGAVNATIQFHDTIAVINDFHHDGSQLFLAHAGGLAISTDDGSTWANKSMAQGLPSNVVTAIGVSGSDIAAGTQKGVAISADSGNSFTIIHEGNGLVSNKINDVIYLPPNLYVATPQGINISNDHASNFTLENSQTGLTNPYVQRLAIDSGDLFALTSSGLCHTNATTISWNCIDQGLGSDLKAMAVVGNLVLIGSRSGLKRSTDRGVTFASVDLNPDETIAVNDISITGSNVYVATAMGLFKSLDSGVTFSEAIDTSNGLPATKTFRVLADGNDILVGTYEGASLSTDGGTTFGGSLTESFGTGMRYGYVQWSGLSGNSPKTVQNFEVATTIGPISQMSLKDSLLVADIIPGGEKEIVIGMPYRDAFGFSQAGQVVIYQYSGSNWSPTKIISSPHASDSGHFGLALEASSDFLAEPVILIGAPGEDSSKGNVYVYKYSDLDQPHFSLSSPRPDGRFGSSIDVCDVADDSVPEIIIGSPESDEVFAANGQGASLSPGSYMLHSSPSAVGSFSTSNFPLSGSGKFGARVQCVESISSTRKFLAISSPEFGFLNNGKVTIFDHTFAAMATKTGNLSENLGTHISSFILGSAPILAVGSEPSDHPDDGILPSSSKLFLLRGATTFSDGLIATLYNVQNQSKVVGSGFGGGFMDLVSDLNNDGYQDLGISAPNTTPGLVKVVDAVTLKTIGEIKKTSGTHFGSGVAPGDHHFTYDSAAFGHMVVSDPGDGVNSGYIYVLRVK